MTLLEMIRKLKYSWDRTIILPQQLNNFTRCRKEKGPIYVIFNNNNRRRDDRKQNCVPICSDDHIWLDWLIGWFIPTQPTCYFCYINFTWVYLCKSWIESVSIMWITGEKVKREAEFSCIKLKYISYDIIN